MRSRLLAIILTSLIFSKAFAYQDRFEDINKTAQEILKQAYEMFEKSKEIIESMTKSEQKVLPEKKDSFFLYYKRVKNSLPVQERNDFLITAQIKYKIGIQKDISLGNILIITKNGNVELFGKVSSKEDAEKIIDLALKTNGVKEVVSYLIIIEPKTLSL